MRSHSIAKLIYNGAVYPALALGASVSALFSRKLRTGLEGRVGLAERAGRFRNNHQTDRIVLFHCASAGELEGTKPLAMACRQRGWMCAVSYFSPSAVSALKGGEFEFADYSPRDSVKSAREYLEALRPDVVMISKHDVWPNMVWQARQLGIPVWLINGNFHANTLKLFPGLRHFNRTVHSELTGILTVSEDDAKRARRIAGESCRIAAVGDSRFDRVITRAQAAPDPAPELLAVIGKRTVLLGGSSHERDEELLIESFVELRTSRSDFCLLLVPHDPSEAAVSRIKALAEPRSLRVSDLSITNDQADVIVVNKTGVLADLYKVAKLAYVGGGFDRGVHSVLEPMAHGCEVICGPNISVSREANEAQALGLLEVVTSAVELTHAIQRRLGSTNRDEVIRFVNQRGGVVNRILDIALPAHGAA